MNSVLRPIAMTGNQFLQFAGGAHLLTHHLSIAAADGDQFLVRAGLDDSAAFNDHDPIGVDDRAEPMGDHETGAAFDEQT